MVETIPMGTDSDQSSGRTVEDVEQPRTAEGLRALIDEALEEIERTELEMLDLLADVLGPDEAKRVADQIAVQSEAPRFKRLLGTDLASVDRGERGDLPPERRRDPSGRK